MGKLGIVLEQQKEAVKGIFKRYLITLISVNVLCVVNVVYEIVDDAGNWSKGAYDVFLRISLFLVFFALGSLYIESVLTEDGSNRKKRIIHYIVAAAISTVFVILAVNLDVFSDMTKIVIAKICVFYVILCGGLALISLIKKSGMSFSKYIVNCVFGFIKVGAVCLVLNIGIMLLIGLFSTLLVEIVKWWNVIYYIEILLSGIVYVPYVLICLVDKTENKSKFVRGFLFYALMPMVLVAMLFIYLYILKIFVTGIVPNNEVFDICATLFAIGVVIWTMAYSYVEDEWEENSKAARTYSNIVKYAKYIYAPFVLLEMYCIGTRIYYYGVTTERYWAVVFIIAQIIYIAWEPIYAMCLSLAKKIRKKSDGTEKKTGYGAGYENLIYVGFVFYIFCVLLPFFNDQKVEFLSQKKRFEAVFDKDIDSQTINNLILSNVERKELYSIYNVLRWNEYGREYLDERYTEEEQKLLSKYLNKGYSYGSSESYDSIWESYYIDPKNTNGVDAYSTIPVSGYDYIHGFRCYDGFGDGVAYKKEVVLTYGEDRDCTVTIDITELVDSIVDSPSDERYEQLPYEITQDGMKIVINKISFEYNTEDGTIEMRQIDGYILEKADGVNTNE